MEPSLVVSIDEGTQNVTIAFTPQRLQPQEYGVVIASVITHIAGCFVESNPGSDPARILEALLDGVKFGLEHDDSTSPPAAKH